MSKSKGGRTIMDPNNVRMREFIYSLITINPKLTILDLGCGQGYDLFRISQLMDNESKLFGMDTNQKSIIKANENYGQDTRMNFIHHNFGQNIPFDENSFDLVFSNNVLECIADKQHLLREVHRVLKPEGQVIFAHFDWDSQLIDGDNKELIRTITQTFNDCGSEIIEDWYFRRSRANATINYSYCFGC
ncbi:methyltransferase domain-containing protein [Cohnella yongneupensis]|uniref:Methyltransferase domain-containing protein n=1 Tax=Cohnella yongneupensis TaxID=425006 RepID=A0ABW0QZD9_9BACL